MLGRHVGAAHKLSYTNALSIEYLLDVIRGYVVGGRDSEGGRERQHERMYVCVCVCVFLEVFVSSIRV